MLLGNSPIEGYGTVYGILKFIVIDIVVGNSGVRRIPIGIALVCVTFRSVGENPNRTDVCAYGSCISFNRVILRVVLDRLLIFRPNNFRYVFVNNKPVSKLRQIVVAGRLQGHIVAACIAGNLTVSVEHFHSAEIVAGIARVFANRLELYKYRDNVADIT